MSLLPRLVNGYWRKPVLKKRDVEPFVPRPPPTQEFRIKKEIVKSKARFDPDLLAQKAAKFPPQIAARQKYKVIEKMEEKKGSNVYRRNWQDNMARQIRRDWKAKRDFRKPHTGEAVPEIRRVLMVRLLTSKPWELNGCI